jgi:pyridoxine 4-dehydrogenase
VLTSSDSVPLAGGLEVSPLGVGAWAWGDKLFWGYDDNQETQACEAFNTAVDLGVTLFDTAEVYKTLSIQKARELPTQHLRWRCIHCALL